MTAPKNAVSLFTAAALVVAPVGGVAANYKTAHADEGDGDSNVREADETQEGSSVADVEIKKANGGYESEDQYQEDLKGALEGDTAPEPPASEETGGEQAPEGGSDAGSGDAEGSEGSEGDGTQGGDAGGSIEGTLPETPEVPGEGEGEGEAPGKPVVPTFGSSTLEKEAVAALEAAGLTAAVEYQHSDTVAKGCVIGTNPEGGTAVEPGSTVTVFVSQGKQADTTDPDEGEKPGGSEGEKPGGDEGEKPSTPETPEPPAIDPSNPVDDNVQKPKPDGAGGTTDSSHTAAVNKAQAQTPLKQVAVSVPSISFTHMDNSSYVARHYSEDLTTEKFISLVGESARTIAAENDLYASVMIAQAILESASGNSQLAQAPNNNLFGIKGTYKGNSVALATREDDGSGSTYTITAEFRQYDTVDESLSDYADLLSNSMGDFYAGARKSNTDTFVDACDFLVGRYATDIFYSEKLQDLIETYDLTRFDVPLTYELTETFVLPVKDEVTGLDLYLDPVADKEAYEALVAEYYDYVDATSEYQQALATWEQQMARAEELYHVPVYLEKPSMPAADTAMQQHQNAINAERFEGFDKLIAAGAPLPVREARTLNDLTSLANSFLGVPYLWGGTTPAGFDCSGLVQYCYREVFNIELPRTTYYQCEVGVEVPFAELLPGDLLFFADGGDVHHVAMYLGDGYYVEAPHTGDVVKITAMNDKLPDFAKRVVDVRDVALSEYSDAQLAMFVEREKYLQEREQRMGVSDEALEELTEWLQGLEF